VKDLQGPGGQEFTISAESSMDRLRLTSRIAPLGGHGSNSGAIKVWAVAEFLAPDLLTRLSSVTFSLLTNQYLLAHPMPTRTPRPHRASRAGSDCAAYRIDNLSGSAAA
jgi:hypothetical protein